MSNGNKLSVSTYIHYAGILLITMALFIGLLFIWEGSLLMSISIALLFFCLFIGVVYLLVQLKKTNKEQQRMLKWERLVLIIGYVGVLGFSSLYVFVHFTNIQFILKKEIQEQGLKRLDNCNLLIGAYEKYVDTLSNIWEIQIDNIFLGTTSNNLRKSFLDKYDIIPYKAYNNRAVKDTTKMKYVESFKARLLNDFYGKKDSIIDYYNKKVSIFTNWNLVKIPNAYNEIPKKVEAWTNEIIELSKSHKRSAESPFAFKQIIKDDLNISNPPSLFHRTNWFITFGLFIIGHVLILWPYLFATRSGQSIIDGKSGIKSGIEIAFRGISK